MNDTPVACQIREPTDPQGDRWHGEAETDEVSPRSGVKLPVPPAGSVPIPPAASAATYPLRCFAPQWARFDNRQKRPAYQPLPSLHQRQRRKRYKQSPEPTTISAVPIPRSQHRQIRTCLPRAKGSLDRRSKRLSFPHFFLRRKKCGRRRPPPRQGETDSPPQRRNSPNPVEANTPTVAGASGRASLRAGERRHSPFDRQ